ncbi:Prephenate dehydratase-domain-containing protein [Entophlyctis helioformis]|nr:Prephenate dehydratase-domain-containing protein [Entophlyctis helioformis]
MCSMIGQGVANTIWFGSSSSRLAIFSDSSPTQPRTSQPTSMTDGLPQLRSRIDDIDTRLVQLLNERASVSISIGSAKKDLGIISQPHIPKREQEVFAQAERLNHGPLPNSAIQAIYREIMSASIALQKDTTIAFLGPRGSYSYQSAYEKFGDSLSYIEKSTIRAVFEAVESGSVTYGLVPFENSTFGTVQQTLDWFVAAAPETRVMVRGETYLAVHHCLLSNTSKDKIKRVYSHPEALGQCSKWLDANLPYVERVNAPSTSKAADIAANEAGAAAICSAVCADLYSLNVLDENIEDLKNNTTRFFIIGHVMDAPTGRDRTLIQFTVDHRQPGALCDALNVMKQREINLTKIDSRPSGQRMWHYVFFVECEGHPQDTPLKDAIGDLNNFCIDVRVLGSYMSLRQ